LEQNKSELVSLSAKAMAQESALVKVLQKVLAMAAVLRRWKM
jgi:hypothetical protein